MHTPAVETSPAVAAPPAGRTTTIVLFVLVLSAFVMILNETVFGIALRELALDLDVATTTVQWLTSGFLLTMAVVIPTTGWLLERFPVRRVYAGAMAVFTVGTLLGGLAPGFEVLLGARVLQAAGTAVMLPLLMTTVMNLVPVDRRGATMGTILIVIAVAPAVGPMTGGAVLTTLTWRWLFWLMLPLAVGALIIGIAVLRVETETRRVPLDLWSVLLSALGFGGVLYGLASAGHAGGRGIAAAFVVGGLTSLTVFAARQRVLQRRGGALLDLRPFLQRDFTVAVVVSTLLFLCFIGSAAILLPLYLQSVLGQSIFVSGLALLPGGLALGLLSRPVGALYDRLGARPLVLPGAFAMVGALWLFASLGAGSPLAAVVAVNVLLMGGLAMVITPLMTASLSALPADLYSHGSAILSTLQQIGGAVGAALLVTVASLGQPHATAVPDAAGLRRAFIVAGCLGLLALVAALHVRSPLQETSATNAVAP